jgi:hypothetical protein
LQVGDTGPVESARRSNSRVLGSPFSGLSGQVLLVCYETDMFVSVVVIQVLNNETNRIILKNYICWVS